MPPSTVQQGNRGDQGHTKVIPKKTNRWGFLTFSGSKARRDTSASLVKNIGKSSHFPGKTQGRELYSLRFAEDRRPENAKTFLGYHSRHIAL